MRVRFVDETADYQTGAAGVTDDAREGGGASDLDLPLVTTAEAAEGVAARRLRAAKAERDTAVLHVGPLEALRRTAGDRVTAEGLSGAWRVARVETDEQPRLTLSRCEAPDAGGRGGAGWTPGPVVEPPGPPALFVLDLPGASEGRPRIAVSAAPWRPMAVWAGASVAGLTERARAERPAVVGRLVEPLAAGPVDRLDRGPGVLVAVEGGQLEGRAAELVFAGANTAAVRAPSGEWEVLSFLSAELAGPGLYRLTGLLRGLEGSDAAAERAKPVDAPFVLLEADLPRAEVSEAERGAPLLWRAAPAGGPPSGLAMTEVAEAWRGLHERPRRAVRLRAARQGDGSVRFAWTRRGRWGEPFDREPATDAGERWLAEAVDDGGVVLARWETAQPEAVWPEAAVGGRTAARLRVTAASDLWPEWGPPREVALSW